MLYLTPNAPPQCGTTTFVHKKSGVRHSSHPEIMTALDWNTTLDRTPYDPVDVIGNVFNRLVIFDARCVHSASEYFGYNIHNARLWQMFFFD
jgi:acid phosphatase family membrane protein YuiD